jgi:hypothetical protein
MLLLMGERHFKAAPAPEIRVALEAVNDVGRLEELAVRLLEVDRWEDLLDPPARPARKRRKP